MSAMASLPPRPDSPRIVAIVPAYNEERFIASVVVAALQHAEHVIVVDDGSGDRTALLARLAGAEVVSLPKNVGKAGAINAGFVRAGELDPDVVVMLDADAQHDPAEMPRLVAPILEDEADVVIGSRFLHIRSEIPRWRRVGQHTLTFLTNRATGTAMTDSQSGYRAFGPGALHSLRFASGGLALESEMQFHLKRSTLRVSEVPISVQYLDGNKRNPVFHGLRVLDTILGLVARRRPLMFIGLPGLLLMMTGFFVGLAVVNSVDHHHPVPFGTVVLSSLLIIAGLVLGVTGVILNTLEKFMSRMQDELRHGLRHMTLRGDSS
jgi:glycosyltransferase involved in cell wall biosynthesis